MDNQYQEEERNPIPLSPLPKPDPPPTLPPRIIVIPKKMGWVQYLLIALGILAVLLVLVAVISGIRGLMAG